MDTLVMTILFFVKVMRLLMVMLERIPLKVVPAMILSMVAQA